MKVAEVLENVSCTHPAKPAHFPPGGIQNLILLQLNDLSMNYLQVVYITLTYRLERLVGMTELLAQSRRLNTGNCCWSGKEY